MGCAAYVSGYNIGVRTSSAAFIKFNEDGSATLITGAVDNGQGNYTMLVHIAAEEIGLPPHQIRVIAADTETTPLDAGSYIMQTAFVSGNAVRQAAADARRQLLRVAAEKLESREEDLKIEEGQIFVEGSPSRALTIRDAVWAGLGKGIQILGKASYMPELATVDWMQGKIDGQVTGAYTYGAVAVEVEVDDKTGKVKVLRNATAHDCGFAINRMAVEGQSEGSALMGQGQALLEEVVFEEGQMLNSSFLSYNLPLSTDAPEMNTIIVESMAKEGPSGAKSAAESGAIAILSAIANAIYDAVGVRIKELPITPEKVLAALKEKRK
jgi:4-hydroxybenzoyl-CoA reductase subunit alpha